MRVLPFKSLRGISCLLLLALALSSCVSSPEARAAGFIESGKKFLKHNDAPRAIIEFRNAIQATPKNPEAYYQVALACLAVGDIRDAVVGLRKAIDLDPKHKAARLRLAQLMADANDQRVLRDAQKRLQELVDESSSDDPYALHALALTELKLGDATEGLRHLGLAVAVAPQELAIAITLAQAKLQQNDVKGAEAVLVKASESAPESVDARVVLGKFYLSENNPTEAEKQFQQALALDPTDGGALLNLAVLQSEMGRKQDAEQSFKRLSAIDGYKTLYGSFLFEDGRKDEAVREFERLAKENPNDRMARTRLVAAYRRVNRTPDAERILNRALKKNPKDLDALLQRGEMYLAAGKFEPAEVALNQVLHLEPKSAEAQYVLAKLYQTRGEPLLYWEELAKTLESNPALLAVRLELVRFLEATNKARAALDILNEAPSVQKQSIPVLAERNWVLWSLGELAEMRKGIDQGLARARSSDLLIQDGLWKLRAGDPARARMAIEEALKVDPTDLRALQALRQTYLAEKNTSMALQKVKDYAAANPKSAPIQDFLGFLLMAQGDTKQARTAFTAASAADPKFVQADLALVQMDFAQGSMEDAKQRLTAVLATDVGNPTARLWLGILEEKMGDRSAAIELYRQVAQSNPNSAQAANNLAYLLAEYGNKPDEALVYAQRAVELAPDDPAYCDTLGWVLYRKGTYAPAVQYLERASAHQAKDNVVWKYHLAMAYAKSGNPARGRSILDAALKLNPNLPEAKVAQQVVGGYH